jgi:hypothetical protein
VGRPCHRWARADQPLPADDNVITFGGVGSGTIVDYVQVHKGADDAIEFFGGTVNVRHIVLDQYDDDGLDTDEGYSGSIQFAILFSDSPTEESRCFEASSGGSTASGVPLLRSSPKISNFVCRHALAGAPLIGQPSGMVLNSGTRFDVLNGFLYSANTAVPCLDIDGASTMTAPAPAFQSVAFSCGGGPYRTTDNDQGTAPETVLTASSTNVATGYTPTFSQVFINGSNESARAPTNPTTVSSFFLNVPYSGAVSGPNDTWYVGWTCGLAGAASC